MNKTLQWLLGAALATVTVVGSGAFVLELQVSGAVKDSRRDLAGISSQAGDLLRDGQRNLVLAAKLENDGRVTIDNLNRAAIDERMYFEQQLPGMMRSVQGTLDGLQTDAGDVHGLLLEATARTHELGPVEANAAGLELQLGTVVQDVDARVKDPHITDAIANLDTNSQQLVQLGQEGVAIGGSVQHMAAEGEAEVHSITHPKPLVSIAEWTMKLTTWAHDLLLR